MTWVLLDSGIYIDLWERGKHEDALLDIGRKYIVRVSSVVLSELRRGARNRRAIRLVEQLREQATDIWNPTSTDWWMAACVVQDVGDRASWDIRKRRDFQNDALIALTAKSRGATLVTTNRRDFEPLQKALGISIILL